MLLNYVLSDVHEVQSIAGAELSVFVAADVAAQLGNDPVTIRNSLDLSLR